MKSSNVRSTKKSSKGNFLSKFTLIFFDRPRLTAIIWLAVFLFGIVSYTTLLKREGFPSINLPIASISGTYLVNDPKLIDNEIVEPISNLLLDQKDVSTVQAQSFSNFFTIFVQYNEGVNAQESIDQLKNKVNDQLKLPSQLQLTYSVPKFGVTGGDSKKIDIAISYYNLSDSEKGLPQNERQLSEEEKAFASKFNTQGVVGGASIFASELKSKNLPLVQDVFVKNPFETAINPLNGELQEIQKSFDRFGYRKDDTNIFRESIIIGVSAKDGADLLKLDEQVSNAVNEINKSDKNGKAVISASFAPNIEENIAELQRVLIEGLLAILIVGSLVIAIRASFITVIAMVSVLSITIGFLFLIGYSLNVITLFAIILSLALIVDDTIIMVEAIDAQRRKRRDARQAVNEATRKISRAMIAATSTAALSFAPLIFVSGILGEFIRAIPITIIASLVISLIVALIFIPFFSKIILLGKKQMGEENVHEKSAGFEDKIAEFITKPMRWAKGKSKRLYFIGFFAFIVGFSFIFAGGAIARYVEFNIFPPSKDTNEISVNLRFDSGTNLNEAQQVADKANQIVGSTLGSNFEQATYFGLADSESAPLRVTLISYTKRGPAASDLVNDLKNQFADFSGAVVSVSQVDAGPPASGFNVRIESDNRDASFMLASDIAKFMENLVLIRPSGEKASLTDVTISSPEIFNRNNGNLGVSISSNFDGNDISTLVNLAQSEIEKEFTEEKIETYGLDKNSLVFDFGQESQNQESFKNLAIAFPLLLLAIYILLAFEFRSLLQPILIFMAIPFSFFGIAAGLYLTNNPFSFFAMLGFFALIGLSIKNTILLTDYANQSRKSGLGPLDSAQAALKERFRPLVATSLTAIVSLIPLAIVSPFWQGLAVVLIFGLLSSTILVITVFPYYYLGAEFFKLRISRKFAIFSLIFLLIVTYLVVSQISISLIWLPIAIWLVILFVYSIKYDFRK